MISLLNVIRVLIPPVGDIFLRFVIILCYPGRNNVSMKEHGPRNATISSYRRSRKDT